jgi:hypothetical protein
LINAACVVSQIHSRKIHGRKMRQNASAIGLVFHCTSKVKEKHTLHLALFGFGFCFSSPEAYSSIEVQRVCGADSGL